MVLRSGVALAGSFAELRVLERLGQAAAVMARSASDDSRIKLVRSRPSSAATQRSKALRKTVTAVSAVRLGVARAVELLGQDGWVEISYAIGGSGEGTVRPTIKALTATRGWPGTDGEGGW